MVEVDGGDDARADELYLAERPATKASRSDRPVDTLPLTCFDDAVVWDRYRDRPPPADQPDRLGICCSGGGIRSASYNLGALQVLREAGCLEEAAYLAAVSGGSYICCAHVATAATCLTDPNLFEEGPPPWAPGSPEERRLRNHSKYIVEGGPLWVVTNFFFGLFANGLPFLAGTFLIGHLGGWLYRQHPRIQGQSAASSYRLWWAVAALLVVLGFAALGIRRYVETKPGLGVSDAALRGLERLTRGAVGLSLFVVVALVVVPELLFRVERFVRGGREGGLALPAVELATLLAAAIALFRMRRRVVRFAPLVLRVLGPLMLVLPLLWFAHAGAYDRLDRGKWLSLAAAAAYLVLIGFFGHNVRWSLHPFYKERLSSVFMVRRAWDETRSTMRAEPVPYEVPIWMSRMQSPSEGPARMPELVVCAALNVSQQLVPPGRSCDTFTFTPREVGSTLTQYRPSARFEAFPGHAPVTLPAMMAISGAAVSPSMGKMTRGWARFFLALFNIRLGVWIPNPLELDRELERAAHADRAGGLARLRDRLRRSWKEPGPLYVLYEALGRNNLERDYVYVSDGGHYENLGLVELLRRGCTLILCFDAAGDDLGSFNTLGQAIALARNELQVEIDIDPVADGLQPDADGFSRTDHVVGTITYPDGRKGTLLFAKAAMPQDAPWDVKSYRSRNPRFPTHSTLDQLFDDEQFQAYQALGAHAAANVMRTLTVLSQRPAGTETS